MFTFWNHFQLIKMLKKKPKNLENLTIEKEHERTNLKNNFSNYNVYYAGT